jgi:5-methylcytosine-specific restriction protein A
MSLVEIDRDAVLAAIAEFDEVGRDAFLDRYGFGDARKFWLVHDGRRYDSKAIVGVAHGYVDGRQAMTAEDFSGGAATVEPTLVSLGFEVERIERFDWTRQEVVLALDLYVSAGALNGGSIPSRRDERVIALSELLNGLSIHPVEGRAPTFRNPSGVYRKLTNLREAERDAAIERGVPGATELPHGSTNLAAIDRAVVDEFWDRWGALAQEASDLRDAASAPEGALAVGTVRRVEIEATNATTYEAAPLSGGTRSRSESVLRDAYVAAMRDAGHDVSARIYGVRAEALSLRCDVFVDDLDLLVEVKSSDSRSLVRYAIGQLFDYAFRHDTRPSLAVLVPYEPRADLLALMESVGIGCIWQTKSGAFRDNRAGAWTP